MRHINCLRDEVFAYKVPLATLYYPLTCETSVNKDVFCWWYQLTAVEIELEQDVTRVAGKDKYKVKKPMEMR